MVGWAGGGGWDVYQNLFFLFWINFLYLFFLIWVKLLVCSLVCLFWAVFYHYPFSVLFGVLFLYVKYVPSVMCVPLYVCFLVSLLLLICANLLMCSQVCFFVCPKSFWLLVVVESNYSNNFLPILKPLPWPSQTRLCK